MLNLVIFSVSDDYCLNSNCFFRGFFWVSENEVAGLTDFSGNVQNCQKIERKKFLFVFCVEVCFLKFWTQNLWRNEFNWTLNVLIKLIIRDYKRITNKQIHYSSTIEFSLNFYLIFCQSYFEYRRFGSFGLISLIKFYFRSSKIGFSPFTKYANEIPKKDNFQKNFQHPFLHLLLAFLLPY